MNRDNLVFAAACLGMLLFGIVFLSLGSVNNMLAERFGLDDIAIGTLTALLPLGILIGSLVFGPIVDRFGYRWMLIVAALVVGIALEGMAFARHESWVQLFVLLIGIGGGALNGATNALAADVSEGQRGARLSLLGVFFGIGAILMPLAIAVLAQYFPLHAIVAGIGTLVVVPIVYCLAIEFPPPKQRGGFALTLVGGMFLDPVFVIACALLAIQSGMEGMSNDWITRYFKKVTLAGQDSDEWRLQLGLVALVLAITATRLVLSQVLTPKNSRYVLLASVGLTSMGAAMLLVSSGYLTALAAAFLIGAGLAAAFPVVLSYIGDRFAGHSGTAFSTIFAIALVGNMAINKSFGYIAQSHGIKHYATTMLGLLACSAVLLIFLFNFLGTNNTQEQE